jgi:8-oxo-dGTP pyrophosphatase MutT (NUDIX family)
LPGFASHATWQAEPALLLTLRAETLRAHAGQWALPGGRIDEGEAPEAAARRELLEELGLALPPEAVLGRLDDYATRSGYVITPVVLWGGPARALVPNPAEVAAVHRVPVAELLRADAPLLDAVPGAEHPVLRLPLGRSWVAAPTAAFLYQFREWVLLGRATRVAHFDQPRFAWR